MIIKYPTPTSSSFPNHGHVYYLFDIKLPVFFFVPSQLIKGKLHKHNTGCDFCSTKPAPWMHKKQQLDADIFHHHRLQQHATLDSNTMLCKHEPITKVKLIFSIIGNAL
jgi:hypothetical protein